MLYHTQRGDAHDAALFTSTGDGADGRVFLGEYNFADTG